MIDCDHPCVTVSLPFEHATVVRARHMMVSDLRTAGAPEDATRDAELVLSELLTNGLKHGAPDLEDSIEVEWCLHDECIVVCVYDAGSVDTLRPRAHSVDSLGGRGLSIVDYLCDVWNVETTGGTRITAEIPRAD